MINYGQFVFAPSKLQLVTVQMNFAIAVLIALTLEQPIVEHSAYFEMVIPF